MLIHRRSLLVLLAGLWLTLDAAQAQSGKAKKGTETIALWPGPPPAGPGPKGAETVTPKGAVKNVARPRLIVYRPKQPNGMAVLVISGGGYAQIERGKESTPAATWLQSQGITALELVYRLPQEGWQTPHVPFQDAQRAMRLIRSRAATFGIDPQQVGVLGFSAGAHLAGTIATAPDVSRYLPVDAADHTTARPAFAALIYPVLTMLPPFNTTQAHRNLLGEHPSREQEIAASIERHVDATTPKTFLAQAVDDPIAPIDNSLLLFHALRQAKVPAAMHVFQTGGHGWGLGAPDAEVHAWPDLFKTWVTLDRAF